jgi:hypothetical protein
MKISGSVIKSHGAYFVRFYTGETVLKENGTKKYLTTTIRLGDKNDPALQRVPDRNKAAQATIEKYRAERSAVPVQAVASSPVTVGQYYRETVLPWWNRKLENGGAETEHSPRLYKALDSLSPTQTRQRCNVAIYGGQRLPLAGRARNTRLER